MLKLQPEEAQAASEPRHTFNPIESDEEKLARLDAERLELAARVDAARAAERPNVLGTIRMLIAKYAITRKEIGELMRVREFAKRTRKPKAEDATAGQGNGAASATNAAAGMQTT